MIPKYAYQVVVYRINGQGTLPQTKSFETVGAALAYSIAEQRHPAVKRIEVLVILDEWSKVH